MNAITDRLDAIRSRVRSKKVIRRANKWRAKQKELGLCVMCPKEAVCENYCDDHRKHTNNRRTELRRQRKVAGLCIHCDTPRVNANFCEYHRKETNANVQKRLNALRLSEEPIAYYRCGVCGKLGRHNARTCPEKHNANLSQPQDSLSRQHDVRTESVSR